MSAARAKTDYDEDDRWHPAVDNDRLTTRSYGHATQGIERSRIAALVKRYYVVAAAGDGQQGCALLDSQMARAAPVDYGAYGPPYLHGAKSCAAVLSRLFAHYHRRLAASVRRLSVKSVRVEGDRGFAILDLGPLRERQMAVERQHDRWRIEALLDESVRHVP